MRRNAAKCGAFLAHFGSIRAILGCFEMRRNAAADPNAAHFGAFRRHATHHVPQRPQHHASHDAIHGADEWLVGRRVARC